MIKKTLCVIALFLRLGGVAFAQSVPLKSINLSGTIASTNTFQVVQGSNNARNGCTIQNNSADTQYVCFDPVSASCASCTKATAVTLGPAANGNSGQSASCSIAGTMVLKDVVCITGTTSDTFFANFQ